MSGSITKSQATDSAESHIRRLLTLLRKRIWIVLTVLIVVVTAVTLRTFLIDPVYESSTLLLIEKEDPNILNFEEVISLDTQGRDFYNTQYRILQSRSLIRSVIEDLNLMNKTEFRAPERTGQEWNEREMSRAIDIFHRALKIQPIENSRLVWLKYRSTDAALSTRIVNTLAKNFIKQDLDRKYLTSQAAVDWLNDRLHNLQDKVKESEGALQQYQEEQMVISFEERREIINQQLKKLNVDITEVRSKKLKTAALYQEIQSLSVTEASFGAIPSITQNSGVQSLKSKHLSLKADREKLFEKYGEKHPEIIKINSEIEYLEGDIQKEIAKIIEGVKTEHRILQSQEAALLKDLDGQKAIAADLNRKLVKFAELQRNVESEKSVLASLLNRSQETSVTVDLKSSNIRVVDAAEVPRRPVKPRKVFDIQMAIVLGLLLGCAGAFFFEYMDDRLSTPEEVKYIIEQPVLGNIPQWREAKKKGRSLVPVDSSLQSPVAEALRLLRVRVADHCKKNGGNTILITGSAPGCGKTFITSNLALFLALDKKRTLVIEGDLRKPTLHKVFDRKSEEGLSDFLASSDVDPNCILHRFPEWPSLFLIPGGKPVASSAELLGSMKMDKLLALLRKEFEIILIDSPPLLAVSDPSVLVQRTDGVLFVAERGRTSKRELAHCKEALEQSGSKLVGVVFNKIRTTDRGYPYYGYYHS
ncbi:GumC family protein [Acidobacteriota bacterium]